MSKHDTMGQKRGFELEPDDVGTHGADEDGPDEGPALGLDAQDVPPDPDVQGAEYSAKDIARMVREEAARESALRGPLLMTELNPKSPPMVWYRRLSGPEVTEAGEWFNETKEWASMFAYRALDSNGNRLFNKLYFNDLLPGNHDMFRRLCAEMVAGSRTQISDEQLGN